MTSFSDPPAGVSSADSLSPLAPFGWTPALARSFREGFPAPCEPGRIVAASRGLALVRTGRQETWSVPSGRLRERLQADGTILCAGDWVALEPAPEGSRARLVDLLPRGPSLIRQAAGAAGRPQCLAANIDRVFLVMGLDRDFNPARLERLLALAWGAGARPVVVLTKRDLVETPEPFARRVQGVAPCVPVVALSSVTGEGVEEVRGHLAPDLTGVLAGSSGAGKSTLLNALMGGELRRTREVRASDGRGRHTTTLRELFRLPGGGCLIDTPGIREVGLCGDGAALDDAFADVAALAAGCRFRDCAHGAEPGCAVQAALAEGSLDPDRYARFLRLRREAAFEAARSDERLWREREEKWRRIGKLQRQIGR